MSRRHLTKDAAAGLAVDPRHCRPGPHQLMTQQLSPTCVHSLSKVMLPSVLGPPDSGSVHTGSLSSAEGCGSVHFSDSLDSLCLRGSVGDSEANVRSVCVDGAVAAGRTV